MAPAPAILSLDCFDTLLWRDTQAPRDVFADLAFAGGAVEPRIWSIHVEPDASDHAREALLGNLAPMARWLGLDEVVVV